MANRQGDKAPDINQDLDFSRREWRVERVGWVIMALVVLAALLGLLGRGPLTEKVAWDAGSEMWVEYDSVDHMQAPSELKLHVGPGIVTTDELRLALNAAYLSRIEIERIQPEPSAQELAGDEVIYVFDVAEPGQPVDLSLQFRFARPGRVTAVMAIEGGPQLSFNQLVLP
jgi:hypothetical protein